MKHVKLFENWAEENLELPEYLNPEVKRIQGNYTLFHSSVEKKIKNPPNGALVLGIENDYKCNFISFSDYSFWKQRYDKLSISQIGCVHRLQNCFGIPECQTLCLYYTNIKSLKGLEKRKFDKLTIDESNIENLKYCPQSSKFDFYRNPLLSYYGITSNSIQYFAWNLCGYRTYNKAGYDDDNIPTLEQLNDPEFNANVFCYFDNKKIEGYSVSLNPWNQVYEDPSEVENYDFLFVPFYLNSENFRTKAKEYIKNLDITSLDRSDLW